MSIYFSFLLTIKCNLIIFFLTFFDPLVKDVGRDHATHTLKNTALGDRSHRVKCYTTVWHASNLLVIGFTPLRNVTGRVQGSGFDLVGNVTYVSFVYVLTLKFNTASYSADSDIG